LQLAFKPKDTADDHWSTLNSLIWRNLPLHCDEDNFLTHVAS